METARRLSNETREAPPAPKVVERFNQEVRRRERVIRIFPNEESAVRLIGAIFLEIDEVWFSGPRYFDMTEYWEWKANTEKRQKEVNSADNRINAA